MATKAVSQRGISNVRAAWGDASRRLAERTGRDDPDPNTPRNGIQAGKWTGAPFSAMPPDCPVQVLGHNGPVTYVVAASGQLHEVEKWDMPSMAALFAPLSNYMYWAWPAFGKKKAEDEDGNPLPQKVERVERDKLMMCLINEGARRGLFDPKDRVRGRGGWRDKGDRFVWHSGEWLWTVEGGKLKAAVPGELDGNLYTRAPDVQRPWEEPVTHETTPAKDLLKQLGTWSWERPDLDPFLFLGWFATAFMGGALEWRPVVFTTGGAGVGKSTLHKVIQTLFGPSLHATADTTAAGIYQRVKQDSLPVTVDELENKPGSTKATAVIELARLAASGARLYRGGADHEGVDFQARNSFLFSAINPPPLGVQDKSRMAILNLSRLDATKKAMSLVIDENHGRMVLRQVMEGWPRFLGEILPRWKRALHDAGMDSRSQDTYGTLMAAAELMLGHEAMGMAEIDVAHMKGVGDTIAAATASERAEQTDNWQACLEHLYGSTIEAWRSGERPTIGAVLEDLQFKYITVDEARPKLAAAGLGLRKEKDPCEGFALAIPSSHPTLDKIFGDTIWRGGVWTSALKQGPTDVVLRNGERKLHNVKIAGMTKFCVLVDLQKYEAMTSV